MYQLGERKSVVSLSQFKSGGIGEPAGSAAALHILCGVSGRDAGARAPSRAPAASSGLRHGCTDSGLSTFVRRQPACNQESDGRLRPGRRISGGSVSTRPLEAWDGDLSPRLSSSSEPSAAPLAPLPAVRARAGLRGKRSLQGSACPAPSPRRRPDRVPAPHGRWGPGQG